MYATIYDRIQTLQPRLRKLARAMETSQNAADDLYQDMIVHFAERQNADPTFVNQNDSYLIDAGRKYVCLPKLRRARMIISRNASLEAELEGDDSPIEFLQADDIEPETAVEHLENAIAVAQALRSLSGRETEVLALCVQGVTTGEMAAKFGCSPAAISSYKRRIVSKVRAA